MKKTIVVNARFLTQKTSGVQRFAIEICKILKKEFPNVSFLSPADIYHKELADQLEVKVIGKLKGHLWEQIELPSYLKKNSSPYLLNLTNTAPLFYNFSIVTIHDLAVWDFPDSYSLKFRLFYKFLLPKIARNSKTVITVSNFSKNRIRQIFNIPYEKIKVIYNAVSTEFTEVHEVNREKIILAVSSIDPKKNLDNLIEAFTQADLKDYSLVLVGSHNQVFKKKKKERPILTKQILFTGYIDDQTLLNYYRKATVLVYPSFYEGFGIPPLEAMQNGCPVIASSIPAIEEVCGDACLYVNPSDIEDIKNKIILLASNNKLQKELSDKGVSRAKRFSWHTSTSTLIGLINSLINN